MKKLKPKAKTFLIIFFPLGMIYFFFWLLFKIIGIFKPKTASEPQKASAPADPTVGTLSFNVAGVTFKNGRKSRQTILRAIDFSDPPFEEGATYTLEEYEYEGEPAIGVYANDEMIGNVPRERINTVLKILDRIISIDGRVIGGGTVDGEKISYGAKISVKYKKE